jgi:hypothetical protein
LDHRAIGVVRQALRGLRRRFAIFATVAAQKSPPFATGQV